ncbi:MAG: polysaccharide pyruvyl transferase family protein [Armatimonadota bacterium]
MFKCINSLKINIVEWFILAVWYKICYVLGGRYTSLYSKYQDRKKIIFTLIPYHDNLGDHAIAYAARKYLTDFFSDYEIIEVNIQDIYRYAKALRNTMGPDDIVILLGGGNTGDLYRNEEWTRRFIIGAFLDHRIVSLPQTIHFTSTSYGRKEVARSARAYAKHKRFLYISRDPSTKAFIEKNFPGVQTIIQPDMTFVLDESEPVVERKGITVCLRQDKEGFLTPSERDKVMEWISGHYGEFDTFTTTIQRNVYHHTREKELKSLWSHLRSKEVAVTDRFHGMFLCLITKTPCVVIRSFDRKVIEGFQWIKDHQNFIFLVEEPTADAINAAINKAINIKKPELDDLTDIYFGDLRERIFDKL